MNKKIDALESNPLWKQASEIAEQVYSVINELPSEEEWNTKRKLRASANDLIFCIAQALGADQNPNTSQYEWMSARKHLFALKAMYGFSCKQGFVGMEPEFMVKLDTLTTEVNKQIAKTDKLIEREQAEATKAWIKKYETWKEMNT